MPNFFIITPPTTTTLGGVKSKAAVASTFLTSVGTDGSIGAAQPAASDLSNGTSGSGAVLLATDAIAQETFKVLAGGASYVRLWTTAGPAGARNWNLNIQDVEFGDFGIRQSNAQGGNPASAGTTLFRITAAGDITFTKKMSSYNGQATANGGIPVIVPGPAKLTAQSAAISAALAFATGTTPGAGLYRISYVATITTADLVSAVLGGTNGFQVIFTNANGDSVVKTSNPTTPNISAVNATGTTISGVVIGYAAASSNINYNFGYTGAGGQMRYDLCVFVEFLGA